MATVTIDEGWWVGRGPLGGHVAALALQAMVDELGDARRGPRSLTIHFLAPPRPGAADVEVHVERTGRSLAYLRCRMLQGGAPVASALAAFSPPWEGPSFEDLRMPVVAAPDAGDGEATAFPTAPFRDRLRLQHRLGVAPFTGADRAEVGGWMGFRDGRPLDAPALALLADAWFPAPWPVLDRLDPAPTIDLTVHFRRALPHPGVGDLVLGAFRTRHVGDGFFEEDGVLWAPDGTLLAQSRQLALLLGTAP